MMFPSMILILVITAVVAAQVTEQQHEQQTQQPSDEGGVDVQQQDGDVGVVIDDDGSDDNFRSSPHYLKTSLEILWTQAYNAAVEAGDWNRIYGGFAGIKRDSFCTGSPGHWVLTPSDIESTGSTTDLTRVMDRGTFRCGYIADYTHTDNAGAIVMQTGNTTSGDVSGATVEWWDVLASYATDALRNIMSSTTTTINNKTAAPTLLLDPVVIEWNLFNSHQELLDALNLGDIDASCGGSVPDGVWQEPESGTVIARAAAFSPMYCPAYLQQRYIYVQGEIEDGSSASFTTFDELVEYIMDNSSAEDPQTICVYGKSEGGLEKACQNLFDQYTAASDDTAFVDCVGFGTTSTTTLVEKVRAGECLGISTLGVPDDELLSRAFVMIEEPAVQTMMSFFRKNDTVEAEDDMNGTIIEESSPLGTEPTSLQLAMTRTFAQLVDSGVYSETLGQLADMKSSGRCHDAIGWPLPPVSSGSDLEALLNRKVFRCGYPKDLYYATSDGEVLLDTWDPESAFGALPDFFDSLVAQLGAEYNTELSVV